MITRINLRDRIHITYAWCVFIAVMLLTPMPITTYEEQTTYFDKITHAILFGVFAFLIYYTLRAVGEDRIIINPDKNIKLKARNKNKPLNKRPKVPIRRMLIIYLSAFSVSIIYSMSLEYLQAYVPGRSPNDLDFLASIIGVILVLLFVYGDNYAKK
ncbi:hypothetical protein C0583_01585 [Candidatus Parcubacteria bacterium]|nr:MAG: hypothetical protein C0583_01585 [Candidatus Parcubacteria bacterium]